MSEVAEVTVLRCRQVSKVLQGDPDKVLEPYIRGKGNTTILSNKALESSDRLGLYKQPVAFSFCQVPKIPLHRWGCCLPPRADRNFGCLGLHREGRGGGWRGQPRGDGGPDALALQAEGPWHRRDII